MPTFENNSRSQSLSLLLLMYVVTSSAQNVTTSQFENHSDSTATIYNWLGYSFLSIAAFVVLGCCVFTSWESRREKKKLDEAFIAVEEALSDASKFLTNKTSADKIEKTIDDIKKKWDIAEALWKETRYKRLSTKGKDNFKERVNTMQAKLAKMLEEKTSEIIENPRISLSVEPILTAVPLSPVFSTTHIQLNTAPFDSEENSPDTETIPGVLASGSLFAKERYELLNSEAAHLPEYVRGLPNPVTKS